MPPKVGCGTAALSAITTNPQVEGMIPEMSPRTSIIGVPLLQILSLHPTWYLGSTTGQPYWRCATNL